MIYVGFLCYIIFIGMLCFNVLFFVRNAGIHDTTYSVEFKFVFPVFEQLFDQKSCLNRQIQE